MRQAFANPFADTFDFLVVKTENNKIYEYT